jgi:F0F1-type ATP synthase alpha subunit
MLALSLAEQLRDEGRDVLLMMDSVTRFAMAQREIGLAVGEPPTARGYTPSVFARLPQLLERAGNGETGSITGIFTVLVEGDDLNDPVADATRSILDGHLVLTRELADRNHWPAIEVLQSISRLTRDLLTPAQLQLQGRARELLAIVRQNRDLVSVGAYVPGSQPILDEALALLPALEGFLRQDRTARYTLAEGWEGLANALKPLPAPAASRGRGTSTRPPDGASPSILFRPNL